MCHKCHYTILGVTRGESRQGIREAFLRLAKELHPDHAGEKSAAAFREVRHAYAVLSDPQQRRQYDAEIARGVEPKRPARRWQAEPLTRRQRVEPLIPEAPAAVPCLSRSWWLGDLPGQVFGGGGVTPIGSPSQARHHSETDARDLEVLISPDVAVNGGIVTVDIPSRRSCPACAGTGFAWPFPCGWCRQRGWTRVERSLRLRIPPGWRSGTLVELDPEERGSGSEVLRLRILVDRRMRAPPAT